MLRDEAERDLLSCAAANRPARGVRTRVGDVRVEAGRAVEAVATRKRDCRCLLLTEGTGRGERDEDEVPEEDGDVDEDNEGTN